MERVIKTSTWARSWVTGGVLTAIGVFTFHVAPAHARSAQQTDMAPATQNANQNVDKIGAEVFAARCAMCHGDHRQGNPPTFPSLIGVKQRKSDAEITTLLHNGKGVMPAFPTLKPEEIAGLLHFLGTSPAAAQQSAPPPSAQAMTTPPPATPAGAEVHTSDLAEAGKGLFQQNCAFCHGRDAMGGESGPDLTRSKLVKEDVNGDKISLVVSQGRAPKMPAFNFSATEMSQIVAYIHSQAAMAAKTKGGRRGVDVADLQTGNVEAGKQYFNGAGGCSSCHSPTGDLSGIATRYEGLQLEERMLYPKEVKDKITVTLPSGKVLNGIVAYHDEFTIGMREDNGTYHSWPVNGVKYKIDAPEEAHVELFSKYTDADIHNLMAYIQTLR